MSDYDNAEALAAAEQAIFNQEVSRLLGTGQTDKSRPEPREGSWLRPSGRLRTNHAYFDPIALQWLAKLGYDTSEPSNETPADTARKHLAIQHLAGYIRAVALAGGPTADGLRHELESIGNPFKRRGRSTEPDRYGLPGDPRPLASRKNAPGETPDPEKTVSVRLSRRKNIRMSQDEYDRLEEAAKKAGKKPSALARQLLKEGIDYLDAVTKAERNFCAPAAYLIP
jgi:hypothetical protein